MKTKALWQFTASISAVLLILLYSQNLFAEDKKPATYQTAPGIVVNNVTTTVIGIIKAESKLLATDPDKYYQSIRAALEPSVSFKSIAIKVMGVYGKPKKGDTKEQIATLRAQRKAFTEEFTIGMVKTLGKGLANYADMKIDTLPSDKPLGDARSARITQEVVTTNGQTRIEYHMLKKKTGEWLLVNVILDGINFRKQFGSQFKQAAKVNGGDVDKVIKEWNSAV